VRGSDYLIKSYLASSHLEDYFNYCNCPRDIDLNMKKSLYRKVKALYYHYTILTSQIIHLLIIYYERI